MLVILKTFFAEYLNAMKIIFMFCFSIYFEDLVLSFWCFSSIVIQSASFKSVQNQNGMYLVTFQIGILKFCQIWKMSKLFGYCYWKSKETSQFKMLHVVFQIIVCRQNEFYIWRETIFAIFFVVWFGLLSIWDHAKIFRKTNISYPLIRTRTSGVNKC